MRRRLIWIVPLALVGFTAFVSLGGYVVMRLWNWLTPPLFGWHTLTFWQALALLALCRILVGGFGMHGGGPHSNIRRRVQERMANMTEAERERLRHGMWGAGGGPAPGGGAGQ